VVREAYLGAASSDTTTAARAVSVRPEPERVS